jgi:hypothetical protein
MARLYDEWLKQNEGKLPTVYRKKGKNDKTFLTHKQEQIAISIPLKGGPERAELTEDFLKVIETEYAVRYLEQINVEPTRKNINRILKEMPIENCKFKAQWLQPSDWLANTLIIYPNARPKAVTDQPVSNQLANKLETQTISKELKREESQLTLAHFRKPEVTQGKSEEPVQEEKVKIDLDPLNIKKKFLLPFMDTSLSISESDSEDLLSSKMFKFPFETVTISAAHVKELMKPIDITVEEVISRLKDVVENFPESLVPPSITEKKKPEKKTATKADKSAEKITDKAKIESPRGKKVKFIKSTLKEINNENNARLVGIVSHFCYWTVFGHLHSIGISKDQQQQMFVTIVDLFNKKIPKQLKQMYRSLLILTIRILVENIFVNHFKQFFAVPAQAVLANQRLQCIVSKLFDPDGYFSRFSFLEAGMDALGANLKGKSKMNSKYFSISSMVKSLFPYPQHPRTRALFAKKEIYDGTIENLVKTAAQIDGTMPLLPGKLNYYQKSEPWKNPEFLDIPSRAHLFKVALENMRKPDFA